MSGRLLLDTSVVIALLHEVEEAKQRVRGSEVFVSSTVLGELYYGAEQSRRVTENVAQVDRFAAGVTVLDCDQGTAREYGRIKRALRTKGRMIPENDLWIAATALQHGLTLLARDSHFEEVEALSATVW